MKTHRRIPARSRRTVSFDLKTFRDESAGIRRASAAVISSPLPGCGGLRSSAWQNDAAMIEDNFRLADGMDYKCVFTGVPLAGGKVCVELVPGASEEVAYRTIAERLLLPFEGKLITTEDMGTSPEQMSYMHAVAPGLILGRPIGDGGSGDPSPLTAISVVASIEATARAVLSSGLEGLVVYVKGAGHVGGRIADALLASGSRVILSDIDPVQLEPYADRSEVRVVSVDEVVEADVFCPCAKGGDVGPEFVHGVKAIVGAANNQLTSDEVDRVLLAAGIVYVPDWAVNGGGLISVAAEHFGESREQARDRARQIGDSVAEVLAESHATGKTPLETAYEVCERRQAERAA